MSLKLATYNLHGWYDDDGQPNLERVVDLYRKHLVLTLTYTVLVEYLHRGFEQY